MIVLDTNVISEIFKPRPNERVVAWLTAIPGDTAITTITLAEILAGIRRLPGGLRRHTLGARIEEALRPYRASGAILPFDEKAAVHYSVVVEARRMAGMPIATADAQIAAICRAYPAICATRNTKDFAQTGVELINPWVD